MEWSERITAFSFLLPFDLTIKSTTVAVSELLTYSQKSTCRKRGVEDKTSIICASLFCKCCNPLFTSPTRRYFLKKKLFQWAESVKVQIVSALCGGLCVISVQVCIFVHTVHVSHKHSVAVLQEQLRIRIPWKTSQTVNI